MRTGERWWALPLSTTVGAVVSALTFTRLGLRPWEALPVGAGVLVLVYLALRRR